MRRVAFYAPMKPPGDPVPSGDREMARGLLRALEAGGLEPVIASGFRSREPLGDPAAQARLAEAAKREAARLCAAPELRGLAAWVTYHNYYKAPDLIGPTVSRTLGLPYVLIEATRARTRLRGPWSRFAAAAEAASDAADVIFYFTRHDRDALERDRPEGQRLLELPPFLPEADLPGPAPLADGASVLVAGMMRAGDKLASYRLVADAFARLSGDWRAEIAGDGPARAEVEALMASYQPRVRLLGRLERAEMNAAYGRASLFFWPGVNEAFGMVYLEAQAHGLPVVAQDRPGVRDVLCPGHHPDPEAGAEALAAEIGGLLGDGALRRARGAAARSHIAARHLIGGAARRLASAIAPLAGGTS